MDERYLKEYKDEDEQRTNEAKQGDKSISEQPQTLGYGEKQLYVSTIKNRLESKKHQLKMELELVEMALKDCTPEVEQTLRLAKTLDKLGIRTRL